MTAALLLVLGSNPSAGVAGTLPANFQESTVFSGLTNPTVVRSATDGRVFVAEKSGLIKVFDNLSDTTPTVFADLNVNTYNFWDRGLLGMALDPSFPRAPTSTSSTRTTRTRRAPSGLAGGRQVSTRIPPVPVRLARPPTAAW